MATKKTTKKSQVSKAEESTAQKQLPKRKDREKLINYWRDCGLSYDEITAKFEKGFSDAELQELLKKAEN